MPLGSLCVYGLCVSLGTAFGFQSSEAQPSGYRSQASVLQPPGANLQSSDFQATDVGAPGYSFELEAVGWSLQPHPGGYFLGGPGGHTACGREDCALILVTPTAICASECQKHLVKLVVAKICPGKT